MTLNARKSCADSFLKIKTDDNRVENISCCKKYLLLSRAPVKLVRSDFCQTGSVINFSTVKQISERETVETIICPVLFVDFAELVERASIK